MFLTARSSRTTPRGVSIRARDGAVIRIVSILALIAAGALSSAGGVDAADPKSADPNSGHATTNGRTPNILIITVDDMNRDSVGVFDCPVPETTPNIDRLARRGLRYQHAHVQTGSCNPSRNVLFSGRYSHNTGVEGFYDVPDADYPHLVDVMQSAGYFVGIRGKVSHSTPYTPYRWDADLTVVDGKNLPAKDPQSYFQSTREGIAMAADVGKPFCLNINVSDPHKPFFGVSKKGKPIDDPYQPSRVYTPEEIVVPGFLIDHPDVRQEMALYYSSVRRADDCVGKILEALDQSGQRDRTIVVFLSDHGMPFPFAKTGIWHHSTVTPLVIVWPGVTTPQSIDNKHVVSAVDLLPTLMDITGQPPLAEFDGTTFLPTIKGQPQPGRETVYKFHNENSGRNRSPMRSVEGRRYGYIFSAWPNDKRTFKTATTGTAAFRTMKTLATEDPAVADRLRQFQYGVAEEFYDYQSDPDALSNLIDAPEQQKRINDLREEMLHYMIQSNDPLLPVFQKREDRSFASNFVDQLQAKTDAREAAKRQRLKEKREPAMLATQERQLDLFDLTADRGNDDSQTVIATISHRLPDELGSRKLFVTLKGSKGQRIERKQFEARGNGTVKATFKIPDPPVRQKLSVAAFVGEDYQHCLQHKVSPVQ